MAHKLPLRHTDFNTKHLAAESAKLEAENQRVLLDRQTVNPTPLQIPQQQQQHTTLQLDRRERIPRPQIDERVKQSDWNFFKSQWDIYVTGTNLTGSSVVLHLWEACSESLQRSLHHAGAGSVTYSHQLMNNIKQLAVKKHNNLVKFLELQKMGQQRGKNISTY